MKKYVVLLLPFLFVFSFIMNVNAASDSVSLKPILPNNQQKGVTGYFDLNMIKNQKQTIYIVIENPTNDSKNLNVFPSNGLTNQNGGVDYTIGEGGDMSYSLDKSFLIKQYLETENQVTIHPHTQEEIPITIHAPNREGTYIGGILFSEKQPNEAGNDSSHNGFGIKQQSLFGVALEFTVDKPDTQKFVFKKAQINVFPSGTYLSVTFENQAAELLNNVTGTYALKKGNETLFDGKIDSFKMAPMTGIQYPIPWNYKELSNGTYHIELNLVADGKEQKISEDVPFQVTKTQKYVNPTKPVNNQPKMQNGSEKKPLNKDNSKTENGSWVWIMVCFVLFVLGVWIGIKIKKKR